MKARIAKISDIAGIVPGFSAKGAITHDPDGTHQVIMGRHLVPGEPYIYSAEHELRMNPGRLADKYLLAPDDILLMSRGLVNYPIILKEFPQPAIAPSTFNVIRANRDVLQPDYLVWAMSQESFQSQLHEVRIGSGTAMIARGDLDELTIPVPPLDMQKKIVQLAELMRYERRLRRELLGETDRLQAAIGRKIINSISDSE